ncbi:MAG: hypothetical protein KC931_22570, partial [Candidatus Omnitrophica bacterium]|nr:hypothetical protein [Candidatus Omnitrophota bacterium]
MGFNGKTRLVIFAKLPRIGRVKTRLARSVGDRKALALYRDWVPPFINRLVEELPEASIEVTLAVDAASEDATASIQEAQRWLPAALDWSIQEGNGLGERLTS